MSHENGNSGRGKYLAPCVDRPRQPDLLFGGQHYVGFFSGNDSKEVGTTGATPLVREASCIQAHIINAESRRKRALIMMAPRRSGLLRQCWEKRAIACLRQANAFDIVDNAGVDRVRCVVFMPRTAGSKACVGLVIRQDNCVVRRHQEQGGMLMSQCCPAVRCDAQIQNSSSRQTSSKFSEFLLEEYAR